MQTRRQYGKIMTTDLNTLWHRPLDVLVGRARRLAILKLVQKYDRVGINCRGGIGLDRDMKKLQKDSLIVISRDQISALPHIKITIARLTDAGRDILAQ